MGRLADNATIRGIYNKSEHYLAELVVNRVCPGCGSAAVVHNGVNNVRDTAAPMPGLRQELHPLHRYYELAEEDVKYLYSLCFQTKG